jgi:hypothetical protein
VLYPASFTVEEMDLCFRAFLTSILCPTCSMPELIHHGAKKGRKGMSIGGTKVRVVCRACGGSQRDTKFVDFVLAHPPQPNTTE